MSKKKVEPAKLRTFYYHPDGLDNDGNDGPVPTDEGWIVVVGRDANSAVARLPRKARAKVEKVWAKYKAEPDTTYGDFSDFEDVLGASAGWGLGFSFLNEADWEATLEEWSTDAEIE